MSNHADDIIREIKEKMSIIEETSKLIQQIELERAIKKVSVVDLLIEQEAYDVAKAYIDFLKERQKSVVHKPVEKKKAPVAKKEKINHGASTPSGEGA
jgi:hypothetical protein